MKNVNSFNDVLLILRYVANELNVIEGKTLIQKTIYFVNEKLKLGIDFSPYYYGPYSSDVTATLTELKQMGIIEEEVEKYNESSRVWEFEPKLFKYTITKFGLSLAREIESDFNEEANKIKESVDEIKNASKGDYKILSIAGKMYNILKGAGKPMVVDDIIKEAKSLNWNIKKEDAKKSVQFLKDINLVSHPE